MNRRFFVALGVSTIASTVLSLQLNAFGFGPNNGTRSALAAACLPVNQANANFSVNTGGQLGNLTAGSSDNVGGFQRVVCPITADFSSGINNQVGRPSTALNIFLNGFAGPECANPNSGLANITLSACRASATGGSAACSGGTDSGSAHSQVVNLHLVPDTAWTGGGVNDGYFLYVGMQGTCNGSSTVLFSYSFS